MKTKGLTYLLMTGMMLLSSCQEKPEDGPMLPIGFSTALTKAPVTDVSGMDGTAFEVSAAYTEGASYNAVSSQTVMDRREVTYSSGTCSYSPTEYWLPGGTYRFRAIWPAGQVSSLSDDLSSISFTYTTPAAIASQVDLMISDLQEVSTTTPVTIPMAPVAFTFSHLLANIRLNVKVDNTAGDDVFKLTGMQLSGVKSKGAYTDGSWDVSAGTPVTFSVSSFSNSGILDKANWTPVFGDGGLLVIPQSLAGGDIKLTVNYTVTHNGTPSAKSPTIVLPAPTGGKWDAGKIYSYKLEMKENYEIRFGAPDIEPWGEEQLGGTVIIK